MGTLVGTLERATHLLCFVVSWNSPGNEFIKQNLRRTLGLKEGLLLTSQRQHLVALWREEEPILIKGKRGRARCFPLWPCKQVYS